MATLGHKPRRTRPPGLSGDSVRLGWRCVSQAGSRWNLAARSDAFIGVWWPSTGRSGDFVTWIVPQVNRDTTDYRALPRFIIETETSQLQGSSTR